MDREDLLYQEEKDKQRILDEFEARQYGGIKKNRKCNNAQRKNKRKKKMQKWKRI